VVSAFLLTAMHIYLVNNNTLRADSSVSTYLVRKKRWDAKKERKEY
jgi:hypothetical protein